MCRERKKGLAWELGNQFSASVSLFTVRNKCEFLEAYFFHWNHLIFKLLSTKAINGLFLEGNFEKSFIYLHIFWSSFH